MKIDPGWAEFNDATAKVRGRIVAASGTFSGVFSADNVDAITELNIRNGAVSSYYTFDEARDDILEFTVPALKDVSLIDIVAPMAVGFYGGTYGVLTVSLYRNGDLIASDQIGFYDEYQAMTNLIAVRYIDLEVNAENYTVYRLVGSWGGDNREPYGLFLGRAVVGCRKR